MHLYIKIIFGILGLISLCFCKDLPSYFPRCHIDDPNLNDCFVKATELVRPYISKGVPEIQIPPFNPLRIPKMEMEQGTANLNYKLTFTDVEIRGMDQYKFDYLHYNPDTFRFNGSAHFPQLDFKANYEIIGKFLLLPVQGKGVAKIVVEPSSGKLQVRGKLGERNGEEYFIPDKVKVKIDITGGSIYLNGLFNGNKELEEATNQALNDNSRELLKDITPAIEDVTKGLLFKMMQGMNNVPYKKLLPLSK